MPKLYPNFINVKTETHQDWQILQTFMTAQSKSKKMSDSVGDAGGNCIAILVVVGEG